MWQLSQRSTRAAPNDVTIVCSIFGVFASSDARSASVFACAFACAKYAFW
jgi:hypothetical protein